MPDYQLKVTLKPLSLLRFHGPTVYNMQVMKNANLVLQEASEASTPASGINKVTRAL
jgi:hypothetical protein